MAKSVMDELREEAMAAQRELKQGDYLQWKDLEDGNAVVFDIFDGYKHEKTVKPEKQSYSYTFLQWMTPHYILFDIDGNVIKEGEAEDRADGSQFFAMPSKEKLIEQIEEAIDQGKTVCYMTGHELRTFIPKGQQREVTYHKVTIKFGTDNGAYGQMLLGQA